MRRTKGLLLFSLVLFIESESMFQRQKKQNFPFITFVHAKAFLAKGRTQNGFSGQGRKLRNQTSPYIHKMCRFALFKFHTFFKLPRFLVILKYPDSFGSVRKVLNNPKIYMACVENAWKVIKPTGYIYVSSCSPESFLTF